QDPSEHLVHRMTTIVLAISFDKTNYSKRNHCSFKVVKLIFLGFLTTTDNNNEFENIQIKEHSNCKSLYIINLKQDYTDIEQHKQQRIDEIIQQDDNESSINTEFCILVQSLEYYEEEINEQFQNDATEQTEELKKRLIDVKQLTLTKDQELIASK
ncbi:unnamed protein product, partial [Rotaria sp. Silwood2]